MTSLQEIYTRGIADGTLRHDAAQEAVLDEFERIRDAVSQPVRQGGEAGC